MYMLFRFEFLLIVNEFISWASLGLHFVNYLCIFFASVSNEMVIFVIIFMY